MSPTQDFLIAPDVPTRIQFNVTGAPTTLHFSATDYRGLRAGGTIVALVDSGTAVVQVTFSEGFFELNCTETGQAFGVIAAAPFSTWGVPHDPRFAVVAGFTQICNTVQPPGREPLLALLAKVGI